MHTERKIEPTNQGGQGGSFEFSAVYRRFTVTLPLQKQEEGSGGVHPVGMPAKPEELWFAVVAKSRWELRTADALRHKYYEVFLPLEFSDPLGPRSARAARPLFPGYLFCRFDPVHRLPVLMTAGVCSIVGFGRVPAPVEESEIDSLRLVVEAKVPTAPFAYVDIGAWVRILKGPLRGLEGILLEHRDSHKLIVSVTLLRRSVAVTVDASAVEVVEPAHKSRPIASLGEVLARSA
jgi:transcription antitermination factor NusG